MLMAYEENREFKIAEYPDKELRGGSLPIESHSKALKILKWARSQRKDVTWQIKGKVRCRVWGQPH